MKYYLLRLASTLLAVVLSVQTLHANTNFCIESIHIQGLNRLSRATVLSKIPIKIGEQFELSQSHSLIEQLYQTQFFDHIQLARVGNQLKIIVKERPTIQQIVFEGDLGKLQEILSGVFKEKNITPGSFLDRAMISNIESELLMVLRTQNAHYNAHLKVEIQALKKSNQVTLHVKGDLGPVLRLYGIRLLGNKHFSEQAVLSHLPVTSNRITSVLKNQLVHCTLETEKLTIDALKQFYQDRGYFNVKVDTPQVTISPDWKEAYWTIKLEEGDLYKIGPYRILGLERFDPKKVQALVKLTVSEVYNATEITKTEKALQDYLAEHGYLTPKINIRHYVNEKTKVIKLMIDVDPGKLTYVRKINIVNNYVTKDSAIRGHVQQQEASLYSKKAMDASKSRLNHSGTIETITFVPKPLQDPGLENQVDVEAHVKEKQLNLAGIKADASWTGEGNTWWEKVQLVLRIPFDNILGTGKDLDISLGKEGGDTYGSFQMHYSDPLFNLHGIQWKFDLVKSVASIKRTKDAASESVEAATAKFDQWKRNSMNKKLSDASESFKTKWTQRAPWDEAINKIGTSFYIPFDQFGNTWSFSIAYQNRHFVIGKDATFKNIEDFFEKYGDKFNQIQVKLGWDFNHLKGGVFPNKGIQLYSRLNSVFSLDSNLHYYTIHLGGSLYTTLLKTRHQNAVLGARWEFRYGNTFNQHETFPFFEYTTTNRLRGYKNIGPEETSASSSWHTGGNTLVRGSVMLFLPGPLVSRQNFKTSLFFDIGNVYNTSSWSAIFLNEDNTFLKSVGINLDGVIALPMLGTVPVNISLSYPLDQLSPHKQYLGYGLGLSFM